MAAERLPLSGCILEHLYRLLDLSAPRVQVCMQACLFLGGVRTVLRM